MPSPAPSGVDSADDMHDSTLMPYISDAIGFFCDVLGEGVVGLDVDEQPRAVRRDGRAGWPRIISCGWVMSWMQSNVVTRSTRVVVGQRLDRAGRWNARVGQHRLPTASLGAVERVLRDVVAGERLFGNASAISSTAPPAPQPTSATVMPRLQPVDDAVERREHDREQDGAGSTARSCARCRQRPRRRGCRSRGPTPVRKLSGISSSASIVCGKPVEHAHAVRGMVGRREHGGGLRRQREPLRRRRCRRRPASLRPGCTPIRAPSARASPAWSASSVGRERPVSGGQRRVQTEPITEVDHARP